MRFALLLALPLLAQAPAPNRVPGRMIDPCPGQTAFNVFVVKVAGSHELGCAAFPPGTTFSTPVNGLVSVLLPPGPPGPAGPQGPPGPMGANSPVFGTSYSIGATTPNSFPILFGGVVASANHVQIFRNGIQLNPPGVPPPSVPGFVVNAVPLTVSPSGFAAVLAEPPTADDNTLFIQAWQ